MSHFDCPRQNGFAYLWVLLLVAFMGLGLTLGVEMYTTGVQRDKEKELLAIGRQFRVAIRRYYESATGSGSATGRLDYPATLEDLLKDNRTPGIKRHLRKIFVDPMTGKAEWGLVRINGRIAGVYSLSDKMPIKQGSFEADDSSFYGKEKYSEWQFTYPSDLMMRGNLKNQNLPGYINPNQPGGPPPPVSGNQIVPVQTYSLPNSEINK